MERIKWAVGVLLLAAVLVYAAAVTWLVAHETDIVFKPGIAMGDLHPAVPFARVRIPEGLETTTVGWILPAADNPESQPWLIFLHGNGANIASRLNILHAERLRALGVNVLAPEYRGFGGTPGVPTESGIDNDGRAAFNYLVAVRHVPPRRIVIYGWSLGTAVAVDVAAHVDEAAVVLEGAFASAADLGAQRYPIMPVRWLMRNPFESIARIDRVHAPLLFLHSPEDEVVPIGEGRRLFEAAHEPKAFVEVRGGHVYAAERDPTFFPKVRDFLVARGVLSAASAVQQSARH